MPLSAANLILKPTFPLDEAEISSRASLLRLGEPLNLIFLITGGLIPLAFEMGMTGILWGLGAGVVASIVFWRVHRMKYRAEAIQQMIAESNSDQDLRLSRVVGHYKNQGMHHYAVALGKFILLKKSIEKEIHRSGEVTEFCEKIDTQVDEICANVCREFDKIAKLDVGMGHLLTQRNETSIDVQQEARTEVLKSISRAYRTLYETNESLKTFRGRIDGAIASPSGVPPALGAEKAKHSTETLVNLKAEIDLAREIRERFCIEDADENDPDYGIFDDSKDHKTKQF